MRSTPLAAAVLGVELRPDYHVVHLAWHAAAAHLARMLMMVALLPRGLIGGLGEDPDAISYPESKHAST